MKNGLALSREINEQTNQQTRVITIPSGGRKKAQMTQELRATAVRV